MVYPYHHHWPFSLVPQPRGLPPHQDLDCEGLTWNSLHLQGSHEITLRQGFVWVGFHIRAMEQWSTTLNSCIFSEIKKKNKTLKWDKCFDTGNGTRNYHGTLDAWHVTKPFGGALFGDLWGQLVGDWAQSKKWPISGAYLTVLPSISIKCHLQAHDYAQEPGIQRRVSDLETKRSVPSVGQICVYIYHISIQVCVCVLYI